MQSQLNLLKLLKSLMPLGLVVAKPSPHQRCETSLLFPCYLPMNPAWCQSAAPSASPTWVCGTMEGESWDRTRRGARLEQPEGWRLFVWLLCFQKVPGGRGQHCAIPAVSVSICPLGHNLLYSKVDTSSRAEDLHPQSSCFSPLASAFSQPSSASPPNRPDLPDVPSDSCKAPKSKEREIPWYNPKVLFLW